MPSRLPPRVDLPEKANPEFRAAVQQAFARVHAQINWTSFDVLTIATSQSVAHDVVLVDASASAVTLTLPPAVDWFDRVLRAKKTDAGVNQVLLVPQAGETLEGTATYTLATQFASVAAVSDGKNWYAF